MKAIPKMGKEIRRGLALQDFECMIDNLEAFLDTLADPKTDFRVKLMDYAKIREDVSEFCRFYAKWLGSSLMERLRHEVYELLEEAVSWWGGQVLYDEIEVLRKCLRKRDSSKNLVIEMICN